MESQHTCLRLAVQADASKIADLELLLFPDNCMNERTISNQIDGHLSWVAERSEELVGYSLAVKRDGLVDLLRLGVREPERRRGVGRQLMILALGTDPAILTVRPRNPAIALYRAAGFRAVGILDGFWVMRRP